MQLFDTKAFRLNPNISWEYIQTPIATLAIIENFYEDVDAVTHELSKLPGAKTASNCDEVEDYRLSYKNTMEGTEFPFTEDYKRVVSTIIECKSNITQSDEIAINVNKLRTDRALREYYNIHKDFKSQPDKQNDVVSTVIMLNDHYSDGEGTSFFMNMEDQPYWVEKDQLELTYFMQGKKNRAVVFSAQMNHGATYSTTQFMDEYRYTQVIFSDIS